MNCKTRTKRLKPITVYCSQQGAGCGTSPPCWTSSNLQMWHQEEKIVWQFLFWSSPLILIVGLVFDCQVPISRAAQRPRQRWRPKQLRTRGPGWSSLLSPESTRLIKSHYDHYQFLDYIDYHDPDLSSPVSLSSSSEHDLILQIE